MATACEEKAAALNTGVLRAAGCSSADGSLDYLAGWVGVGGWVRVREIVQPYKRPGAVQEHSRSSASADVGPRCRARRAGGRAGGEKGWW